MTPSTGRRAARGLASRLALALASLTLSLGLAEGVARYVYEPPLDVASLGYVPFKQSGSFTPPLNRLGLRETPPGPDAFAPNVQRILFLGDSFTFGDGIERGEDRFTDLIEKRLNDDAVQASDPRRYHVYNAGESGSRPRRWLSTFRSLSKTYPPNLVVAVFFLRDGTEICTSLRCHEEEIRTVKARYETRPGYDWSHLVKLYYAPRISREFSDHFSSLVLRSYLGTEQERKPWSQQQVALRKLASACWRLGSELHLIIFPLLFDLHDYPYDGVEAEIHRFAGEARVPSFSLIEGFRGRDAHSLWVAPNDQHANEEGHRLAAETLYPYLRRTLRAASPDSP